MPSRKGIPDDELWAAVAKYGKTKAARILQINIRGVQRRIKFLEQRKQITSAHPTTEVLGRITIALPDGLVISASDCHYCPGPPSLMHRALLKLLPILKPDLMILNGDVTDMSSVSRHPRLDWSELPTVQEEIEAAQERLHEIRSLVPRKCRTIWNCGNHDSRYEKRLIERAPEFAKVHGTSLKDHFPLWEPAWDVHINDDSHNPGDRVVIKHRYKGGVHHAYNDTLQSGRTIVTGDKHALQVTNFTDLNGTRWGVDNGCVADPWHKAFSYSENNPRNWREGFAVLTFKEGRLLPPELVSKWADNKVVFRGEIIEIS